MLGCEGAPVEESLLLTSASNTGLIPSLLTRYYIPQWFPRSDTEVDTAVVAVIGDKAGISQG